MEETGKPHTGKGKKRPLGQPRVFVPLILIVLGLIFGLVWWRYWANFVYTEDAQVSAHLVIVSSPLPAYISQLSVDEGDDVVKTQPLATVILSNIITDKDLKSAHASANIQYEHAKSAVDVLAAQLLDAKKNEQRLDHVYRKGGTSEQSLLDAKTRYEVLKAQYGAAQITLGFSKSILDATRSRLAGIVLKSPINGRVSQRYANLGQNMSPGEPIFGLVDLNDVWIEANIKETHLGPVRPGQRVDIYVDTYPGVQFTGTVLHVESATIGAYSVIPSENPSGTFIKIVQRVPVKIAVDTMGYTLRPGMSVEVKIHVRKFSWF
ncbi:MAG: HlyD family secretion protein [Deltaproteobacteria bacterium]|nr:HlyD family secretion protein [Deltaproteobacteria bacterium]MCL5276320.1 HlyD family secretion protein [Deltaproteobacteria bacterium]